MAEPSAKRAAADPALQSLVRNLPRVFETRDMCHWLTQLKVKFHSARKHGDETIGFVVFSSAEEKAAGDAVLKQSRCRGEKVAVTKNVLERTDYIQWLGPAHVPKVADPDKQRRDKRDVPGASEAPIKTALQIVAPLHAVSYEDQIKKKDSDLREVIFKHPFSLFFFYVYIYVLMFLLSFFFFLSSFFFSFLIILICLRMHIILSLGFAQDAQDDGG